jgi:magnesium transporter
MQIYTEQNQQAVGHSWSAGQEIPADAVWIDLLEPTREEELLVEKFLGMTIPTREEMNEIEVSNRLYEENGALFMTSTMLSKVSTGEPETHPVTFIITSKCMVTVRYIDTTSFRRFGLQFSKAQPKKRSSASVFLALIEAVINRQADILERMDREVDSITRTIFRHRESSERDTGINYQLVLEKIGRCGDITAKIHESLVTFSRVMVFAEHHAAFVEVEQKLQSTSIRSDIVGLSDHGNHLAARMNFMLDATLGMINIQQNGVFRVLSIASLIFLPPTLVAGIYGMNFKLMPELGWHLGYPIALGLMLVAAILPLAYLRQRRVL